MVHAGVNPAWRQNMIASQRKNGDKFLLGEKVRKAQVQKVFNRPLRRAAQLC